MNGKTPLKDVNQEATMTRFRFLNKPGLWKLDWQDRKNRSRETRYCRSAKDEDGLDLFGVVALKTEK
jgi:hypothetical protein